jgi:hypothetical protein
MSKRKWAWTCKTCKGRETESATHCRTCRNPRGSPQAPFVLKVYEWSFMDVGAGEGGNMAFMEFTAEQLRRGIKSGEFFEGCFNGHRCHSTWGPFISLWPEEFQFLKTDGYEGPNMGHPEDY